MATAIHVNGRADVVMCPMDDHEAGVLLGWTVDGVTIDIEQFHNEIYTDNRGPSVPQDVQYFGSTATITMDLIVYDSAVDPIGDYVGINSNPFNYGDLIVQCDLGWAVNIKKETQCHVEAQGPWTFLVCYLDDGASNSFRVGSLETRHHLVFKCIPNSTGQLFAFANVGLA